MLLCSESMVSGGLPRVLAALVPPPVLARRRALWHGRGATRGYDMTNSVAAGLGALILAALALNFWLGLDAHIFLARRFVDLTNAIAFWR